MHPIRINQLSAAQHAELDHANRTAKDGRLRVRALIVLLAAERGMVAAEIAAVVRMHDETVRRWLVRYQAEGVEGLTDAPRSGAPRRSAWVPRPVARGCTAPATHAGPAVLALDRRPPC
jgi:hypothetical protein